MPENFAAGFEGVALGTLLARLPPIPRRTNLSPGTTSNPTSKGLQIPTQSYVSV